jgi:hypothetical protein
MMRGRSRWKGAAAAALAALLVAGVVAAPCHAQPEGASQQDFPKITGWSVSGEVRTYTPDTLWEYINGASELFLAYDFQYCRTADLASGGLVVTVDLYDMGSPLNAFGIFVRERPEKGEPLDSAAEAVLSPPYQALLLKGATYVKVNVFEGDLTEETGRPLLEAIAQVLPGPAGLPGDLALLPKEGMVPDSEGFTRQAYLGLPELRNCLYAAYSAAGDEKFEYFVVTSAPGESLEEAWAGLSGNWSAREHRGHQVLFREIPYRGLVGIVRTERGIFGASASADEAIMLRKLEAFIH